VTVTVQITPRLVAITPNLEVLRIDYNKTDGISACWRSNLSAPICSLHSIKELHLSSGGGFGERWVFPADGREDIVSYSPYAYFNMPSSSGLSSFMANRLYLQRLKAESDGCPNRLQDIVLP
jgi:hypothetical protein